MVTTDIFVIMTFTFLVWSRPEISPRQTRTAQEMAKENRLSPALPFFFLSLTTRPSFDLLLSSPILIYDISPPPLQVPEERTNRSRQLERPHSLPHCLRVTGLRGEVNLLCPAATRIFDGERRKKCVGKLV